MYFSHSNALQIVNRRYFFSFAFLCFGAPSQGSCFMVKPIHRLALCRLMRLREVFSSTSSCRPLGTSHNTASQSPMTDLRKQFHCITAIFRTISRGLSTKVVFFGESFRKKKRSCSAQPYFDCQSSEMYFRLLRIAFWRFCNDNTKINSEMLFTRPEGQNEICV
jgi:hypothetical protein